MLSEPKNKQKYRKDLEQFSLLNHLLFSNVATLISSVVHQPEKDYSEQAVEEARKSLALLTESIRKFDARYQAPQLEIAPIHSVSAPLTDAQLDGQLQHIHKITTDISRTVNTILST
jgi:hypothetical protein